MDSTETRGLHEILWNRRIVNERFLSGSRFTTPCFLSSLEFLRGDSFSSKSQICTYMYLQTSPCVVAIRESYREYDSSTPGHDIHDTYADQQFPPLSTTLKFSSGRFNITFWSWELQRPEHWTRTDHHWHQQALPRESSSPSLATRNRQL